MPFIIYKETPAKRHFKLKKRLCVTADNRAVAETDTAAIRLLGSVGSLISEEDAKKYGLDASQIESDEPEYVPPSAEPSAPESAPDPEPPKKAKKEKEPEA